MAQETSDRTGITIVKIIWRLGGWLIGAVIVAAARQLILSSGGPEMIGVILESVGAALLVGGIGIALIWLGQQMWGLGQLMWRMCPRQRFLAIAPLIDATRDGLHEDHPERLTPKYDGPPRYTSPKTKTLLHQIIHELNKLSVPHPRFGYKVNRWIIFLERLSADSKTGELETGRDRWLAMKRDDGDSDEG